MSQRAERTFAGRSERGRAASVVAAMLLGGFVVLAFMASGAGDVPGDARFLAWLQGRSWPVLEWAGDGTNWLFNGGPVTAVILFLLAASLILGWRTEAASLVVVAVVRVLNGALKWLIDSPRPGADFIREGDPPTSNGFPSGHTASAVLVCGTVAWLLSRHVRSGAARAAIWALTFVLVAITGFGRMWVGAHWLSDVLGGVLWASAAVIAICAWVPRLVRNRLQ